MIRIFSILPKSAVPLDKLSFVGGSANSACPVSFRFVYQRGRRFYIIERASVPNANVVKYVTTKYLYEDVFLN